MRVEVFHDGQWKKITHTSYNGKNVEGVAGRFITPYGTIQLRILDETSIEDRDKKESEIKYNGENICKETYNDSSGSLAWEQCDDNHGFCW